MWEGHPSSAPSIPKVLALIQGIPLWFQTSLTLYREWQYQFLTQTDMHKLTESTTDMNLTTSTPNMHQCVNVVGKAHASSHTGCNHSIRSHPPELYKCCEAEVPKLALPVLFGALIHKPLGREVTGDSTIHRTDTQQLTIICTHTRTLARTHARTHAQIHTHVRARTHTYTHLAYLAATSLVTAVALLQFQGEQETQTQTHNAQRCNSSPVYVGGPATATSLIHYCTCTQ